MIRIYAFIFALSGVSGLIYESVWSHYVKLILGHAAFAQTMVLTIFMGGMAGGAWLAARLSNRLPSLLLGYAAVEATIGIIAIAFQPIFETSTSLLFDSILPALDPGGAAMAAKLAVSTLLLLPQSILLGATFPLMSGGALRVDRKATGGTVAILYFANSIGAVVGVLWSGFWLISTVGLPGTLLTAGLINIALALLVYFLAREGPKEERPEKETPSSADSTHAMRWVLWAAAITGAASFCYEIAWIRMLSMVLGASTHSFELMLAAFILGLALGGLWIKRRIDTIGNPKLFLGVVQLVMGSLALLTLPLYGHVFDIMAAALRGIARTDEGYALFSLASNAIAMLVMIPATFCAGMTLPLLTMILLRSRRGEKAIGQVYAANTLGAIVGIVAAVHLVLPATSLKGLVLFGALLDGTLGLYLIAKALDRYALPKRRVALAGFALTWGYCLQWVELDPKRMVAGVFRTSQPTLAGNVEVLSWKDGKTASIGLTRTTDSGFVTISTNGKPDASINVSGRGAPSPDEPTMVMLAIAPLLHSPKIKTVANIGFGSGMTTNTLLMVPQIERVDTIEIEPEMVRSAMIGFGERLPRTFNDPRSNIIIDDARTFFSSQGKKYDLIISEPSNPWVSGVASLFSLEFYRHVTRHLNADGLFVQWIQLYETSPVIVASIVGALDEVFADYRIYALTGSDVLIVASKEKQIPPASYGVLENNELRTELHKIALDAPQDIALRLVGNKQLWSPMLKGIPGWSLNSDYFPFIDQNAARFRFLDQWESTSPLLALGSFPVPVLEALGLRMQPPEGAHFASTPDYLTATNAKVASDIRDRILGTAQPDLASKYWTSLSTLRSDDDCGPMANAHAEALHGFFGGLIPYLNAKDLARMLPRIASGMGCNQPGTAFAAWWNFYQALSSRDWKEVIATTTHLLADMNSQKGPILETLLLADLSARLAIRDKGGFDTTIKQYLLPAFQENKLSQTFMVRLVLAQARQWNWTEISTQRPEEKTTCDQQPGCHYSPERKSGEASTPPF